MDLKFSVSAHIDKPVAEVFEAVADPARLSRYFTTGGAQGRLKGGTTVWWEFADFPGKFPVDVVEVEPNRRIVLRWASQEAPTEADDRERQTTVTFDFEALPDGRTRVDIREEGWQHTQTGLQASYGNCMGWSQMLCALKAWLEYGINLRQGMYV